MDADLDDAHTLLATIAGGYLLTPAGTSGALRRARATVVQRLDDAERVLRDAGHLLPGPPTR